MAVEVYTPKSGSRLRARQSERREYFAFLAATFIFFLAAAIIARVLPKGWQPLAEVGDGQRSIFAEARALADSVLPFVFMS
ncbi:MAG: hypothetical protein AAFR75_01485 [Pseudomonadota bacterium]